MYKLRKIFALFLAIVLATSFSTVAFAAEEENGIPENATKHTVELTVDPGETIGESADEIAPYIWNQGTYNPPANGSGASYSPAFTADHRYLAFEISALTSTGSTVGSTYQVSLLHHLTLSTIASTSRNIDGVTYKIDWVDVTSGDKYLFKVVNHSSTSITVTLTYYTWA